MIKRREDPAARSFMRYARYGFEGAGLSGFALYDSIRGVCANGREAARMLAVCDTLRLLRFLGRTDVETAVRAIYFTYRGKAPRRNEITLRVRRFAVEHYLDDRTVYRYLAYAKRLFLQLAEAHGCPAEKSRKNF